MESPEAVSLWFGNCTSKMVLRKYVEIKYDNEGNRIPSRFMTDFQIDFIEYNQDLLECTYNEHVTSSLSELLKNASYSKSIISELIDFYGENLEEQYNTILSLGYMILSIKNLLKKQNWMVGTLSI
nr:immunity 22 family protein [Bacillus mycoides]